MSEPPLKYQNWVIAMNISSFNYFWKLVANKNSIMVKDHQEKVASCLWEMVQSGVVDFSHQNHQAVYMLNQ